MTSSGSRGATAFPHNGRRHVMQLAIGCNPEGAPSNVRELAMQQLEKAGRQIAGSDKHQGDYHAGFLQEWNKLDEVYGENLPKLKVLKDQYDPKNRFNRGVDLGNEKVTKVV